LDEKRFGEESAMFLDLIDVLRSPGERIEKPLEIAPQALGDIELAAPVRGVIRVENARRNIVVSGKAETAIAVPCSRCLEPMAQKLDLEFEAVAPLSFFNQAGLGAPQTHGSTLDIEDEESEPDDEIVALFEEHSLDVLELVRQAIELQAPIAPLCTPDCAGLPDTQKYFEAPEDTRWGALKNWTDERQSASAPRNGSSQ
jgi:uncharacterized protein